MQLSQDRILTTHVGSLPRPADLLVFAILFPPNWCGPHWPRDDSRHHSPLRFAGSTDKPIRLARAAGGRINPLLCLRRNKREHLTGSSGRGQEEFAATERAVIP